MACQVDPPASLSTSTVTWRMNETATGGRTFKENVLKKVITKGTILIFINCSVCYVLLTSGGSFCTEDISREIICKTTKRNEKSVRERVRFQRLLLTSVKNIESNSASWKLPEARETNVARLWLTLRWHLIGYGGGARLLNQSQSNAKVVNTRANRWLTLSANLRLYLHKLKIRLVVWRRLILSLMAWKRNGNPCGKRNKIT